MSNSNRVLAWRNRAKAKLVEIAGGRCAICGYNRCQKALEFHHLDPNEKDFPVTGSSVTRRFAEMVVEARKCIVLCANCHREVHDGMISQTELDSKQIFLEDVAEKYILETEAARDRGKFKKG